MENPWTENIIVADADYIDRVAFNLIVNFERMLERPIPPADMSHWVECVALDGGMRQRQEAGADADRQETTVVLLHNKESDHLENFRPSHYATELNGQAFSSPLGEFTFHAFSSEGMASKEDFLADTLLTIGSQKAVRRLMVVTDDAIYNKVRATVKTIDETDDTKRITVFSMQPQAGGPFRQELLGFSLMAALGIRGEEIEEKTKK